MLAKYMTASLVGTALFATVAFAQSPSATDSSTTPSATTTAPATTPSTTTSPTSDMHQGQWRSSKVIGLNVYNDSNESLGSINELLFDKSGKIQAVVIGVGGFLGVGEHNVAVPFEKIKWVNEPVPMNSASSTSRPAGGGTTTGAATNTAPTATTKANPWYPDHAVLSASKDELKAMPAFKYSS